jgi:hypothetical protein
VTVGRTILKGKPSFICRLARNGYQSFCRSQYYPNKVCGIYSAGLGGETRLSVVQRRKTDTVWLSEASGSGRSSSDQSRTVCSNPGGSEFNEVCELYLLMFTVAFVLKGTGATVRLHRGKSFRGMTPEIHVNVYGSLPDAPATIAVDDKELVDAPGERLGILMRMRRQYR